MWVSAELELRAAECYSDGREVTTLSPVSHTGHALSHALSLSLFLYLPLLNTGSLQFCTGHAVMPLYPRQSLFPDSTQAEER